jgi:electron transport complex protein RnfG
MPAEQPPTTPDVRPLILLTAALVAAVFTLSLALRQPLHQREQERRRDALGALVAPLTFDNDPLAEQLVLHQRGGRGVTLDQAWPLRRDGRLQAVVVDVASARGYLGPIRLRAAIAVPADADATREERTTRHTVIAVTVVEHRETPGLGDQIETTEWLDTFAGRASSTETPTRWRVRRDGGDIDQMTGATVTSRAATEAVFAALEWVGTHSDDLRRPPQPGAGATGDG